VLQKGALDKKPAPTINHKLARPAARPYAWRAMQPRLRPSALLAALLLACGSLACDHDVEERQLSEMSNQIDHLQVERDDADHDFLAPEAPDTHAATVPPRLPAPAQQPPPVVRLDEGPPAALESPDTDDPTPRPTIRVIGSSRNAQSLTDEASSDTGARPSALDPNAKRDYDAALSLVTAKRYDEALDALAAFLVRYPDHPYADNALFWRGECYFAKGDYLHASEQFEGVVTRFPAGNKAPDALLKLGISRMKLGDPAKAKEIFDRLAQTYPQSEAARRIPPVRVTATTPSGPAPEDHR
jgi:tol-pal system protein YbgF